jgi:hypothetical protein
LPPLLTVMPHQPPSLPTFISTGASWPATGAALGTTHVFAPPAMSAAKIRALGPDRGCSAQACNSRAVPAIVSQPARLVARRPSIIANNPSRGRIHAVM